MKIRGVSYAEAGLKRIYKHPGYSLQGKELHNILHIADRKGGQNRLLTTIYGLYTKTSRMI